MTDSILWSRTEALLAAYARSIGSHPPALSPAGTADVGTCQFRLDKDIAALTTRVFVLRAWSVNDPPSVIANFRAVARGLNDPAIGAMFDRAGGYFELEDSRPTFLLVRNFQVLNEAPEHFAAAVEKLARVARQWTLHWFGEVAAIVHGRKPAPSTFTPLPEQPL